MTAEVSHGRGGAGNFNADDTKYVDGEVVRTGAEGSHGDGAYSAGRGGKCSPYASGKRVHRCVHYLIHGNPELLTAYTDIGAGNIGDIGSVATSRKDKDIVPEIAVRPGEAHDHHTGRGGAGNEQVANGTKKEEEQSSSTHPATHVGLADKLKNKLFGAGKK